MVLLDYSPIKPGLSDILFENGQLLQHVGNKRIHKNILMHQEEYKLATSEEEKDDVAASVLFGIRHGRGKGGSFFERDVDTGLWTRHDAQSAMRQVHTMLQTALTEESTNTEKQIKKRKSWSDDASSSSSLLSCQRAILQNLLNDAERHDQDKEQEGNEITCHQRKKPRLIRKYSVKMLSHGQHEIFSELSELDVSDQNKFVA